MILQDNIKKKAVTCLKMLHHYNIKLKAVTCLKRYKTMILK